MKIRYFDHFTKKVIEVDVSVKVAHYIEKERARQKEEREQQEKEPILSLDELIEKGFQPYSLNSIEREIIIREKERKYLNSNEYKKFRADMKDEIKKKFNEMPDMIKKVMFLRFWKDMSIGQIANALHISRSSAQVYVQRGCGYIKDFLNKDIRKQKLKEKRELEKLVRKFLEEHGDN
ncbi:MAG: hypothetical protein E7345_05555 [Clostridiales bacterium]|nr:hypothetical protein [Clostridiales bacterium]